MLSRRMDCRIKSGNDEVNESGESLPYRNHKAVEVSTDDGTDRIADQLQHRASLIGQHDRLRAAADCGADIARGIDAGHIARAVDVAHGAVEARVGGAEGEAVAQAADADAVGP